MSPFPHHGPLEPDQVFGRDELVDDLVQRITQHRPTVLVGPRRFGKTSVLGSVEARLDDTVTVVRVDLYELRSWADLAARLDDALTAVPANRRRSLDRVAAGLEVNLGIVKATLARPARPDPDATVDRLLDVLVAHARANPTVVVFDEFSSITRVDGAAGLLRTKFQHHYQRIGLLFAGSEPSTMRMLFTDTDQPFYAQADLVQVEPLRLAALTTIVDDGFDGSPPPALAARIHAFTDGHPQRSMQLADAAWVAVERRCRADTCVGGRARPLPGRHRRQPRDAVLRSAAGRPGGHAARRVRRGAVRPRRRTAVALARVGPTRAAAPRATRPAHRARRSAWWSSTRSTPTGSAAASRSDVPL